MTEVTIGSYKIYRYRRWFIDNILCLVNMILSRLSESCACQLTIFLYIIFSLFSCKQFNSYIFLSLDSVKQVMHLISETQAWLLPAYL